MEKYNKILERIEGRIGNTTTYDFQLEDLAISLLGGRFNGVFPLDEIPTLKDGYYIINLDKSYQPGSHWCSIAVSKGDAIFYDSFGRTSELSQIPELSKLNIRFTDPDAEQSITQTNCGARCISWCVLHYLYGDRIALSI